MLTKRPVEIKRERGFFTIAQNSNDVDYIRMAYALALSIKATQKETPFLSIGVTPGTVIIDEYKDAFDEIIEIPWDDNASLSTWKLENEWKVYHMTPYRETIKLDADMLFTTDHSHWWKHLSKKDIVATTSVKTYRNEDIDDTNNVYRETFVKNKLPNIYSGFFYFKQSQAALDFFTLVELITFNWEMFTYEFLDESRPKYFSTDVAYALAAKILDMDKDFISDTNLPTFVHMKSKLQGWNIDNIQEDWQTYVPAYLSPDLKLSIGMNVQKYPFHYHVKNFLTDEIINTLENHLKKNV